MGKKVHLTLTLTLTLTLETLTWFRVRDRKGAEGGAEDRLWRFRARNPCIARPPRSAGWRNLGGHALIL
jgi:hypothetical protein